MSELEKYDVLVLGSGTGGKLIAWTMASEGKRTATIERKCVGDGPAAPDRRINSNSSYAVKQPAELHSCG